MEKRAVVETPAEKEAHEKVAQELKKNFDKKEKNNEKIDLEKK